MYVFSLCFITGLDDDAIEVNGNAESENEDGYEEGWVEHALASGVQVDEKELKKADGRGRHSNKAFPFDDRHPLFTTHHQVLKSKICYSIISGKGRPQYPNRDLLKTDSRRFYRKADRFAKYIVCVSTLVSRTTYTTVKQ